uniref:NADH-plastoquinone oxidoreductase subunit 4L n=1 Tax=Dendrobium sinominutiflorum TaxID=2587348 RepID=UPI001FA7E15F|nr:NADH-plastoquinone oxidoreductase subunit 4L [Dendrobium sinominutiflorum]ULU19136.1 NADH-plastoquinone oxidoreductase subunit 4L [Dendrobium sinominutiflorum]
MVRALMFLELILSSVNRNLVTFSDIFYSRQLKGEIFSIFVIAIVSSIHRNRK